MATSYTSLLGLALPVTGELQGTWGDTVNNAITSLLDTAVAGTTTLNTDADVTLTTTTGASNQARQAIILWTANGTTTRNITAPAQSKIYTVINASAGTQSIVIRGAGPTTGVTIVKGESAQVAWNGSDFIKISNTSGAGSFTNLTVSGDLTLSGGTANGVLYLNGSKVATSGSALTFDGTNLGVGASPTSFGAGYTTLDVYNATNGGYVLVRNSSVTGQVAADGSVGMSVQTRTNHPIYFAINNSEQMRLTSTGLGIGTSSPSVKLHVKASTASADVFYAVNSNSKGLNVNTTSSDNLQISHTNSNYNIDYWVSGTGVHTFSTGGSERMRLDSSGNLGLGTSSPATKLNIENAGACQIQIAYNSTSYGRIGRLSSGNYEFSSYENGASLLFGTTNSNGSTTARMELDRYGNLGLGVTPSAWGSAYKAIQFGTTGALFGESGDAAVYLACNSFIDSAGSNKYITSDFATRYNQENGVHKWMIAPSGTAGNAITFTQAMSLTASGELLLGTTSTTVNPGIVLYGAISNAQIQIGHGNGVSSGEGYMGFQYNGSAIGSITQNGTTAVAYNTSSDYRLKNITGPITTSGAYIDSLNPVEGTWKSDGSTFVGLIAHEVQEASRTQIATGTKDGAEMQAMDYSASELIANLIAEVKSLRQRVATLEAK